MTMLKHIKQMTAYELLLTAVSVALTLACFIAFFWAAAALEFVLRG
jgi:hypothetical protein